MLSNFLLAKEVVDSGNDAQDALSRGKWISIYLEYSKIHNTLCKHDLSPVEAKVYLLVCDKRNSYIGRPEIHSKSKKYTRTDVNSALRKLEQERLIKQYGSKKEEPMYQPARMDISHEIRSYEPWFEILSDFDELLNRLKREMGESIESFGLIGERKIKIRGGKSVPKIAVNVEASFPANSKDDDGERRFCQVFSWKCSHCDKTNQDNTEYSQYEAFTTERKLKCKNCGATYLCYASIGYGWDFEGFNK